MAPSNRKTSTSQNSDLKLFKNDVHFGHTASTASQFNRAPLRSGGTGHLHPSTLNEISDKSLQQFSAYANHYSTHGAQLGIRKVCLIKWPASVCELFFKSFSMTRISILWSVVLVSEATKPLSVLKQLLPLFSPKNKTVSRISVRNIVCYLLNTFLYNIHYRSKVWIN